MSMDRNGRDARLALMAGRQGGAFSFAQALQVGFPRPTIHRRLATGVWVRRLPGVYGFAGSERTRVHDLWSAVLATGPVAVVTHESAALIHGAERLPVRPVTLTVPHGGHARLDGVFVHQIDDLGPLDRTFWNGLPVSRPARAVVELGATQSVAVVGRVADDLVRLRKTTHAQICAALARVARPGKPGVDRVTRVLEERSDGYVPPGSELEGALYSALRAGGLPAPERQFALPGRRDVRSIRGLVDGAYTDAQLLLEADGRRWHARVEAARADRERDAQAARLGWQTLRFVHEQIVDEPGEVCAIVTDTRRVRLQLLGRAA